MLTLLRVVYFGLQEVERTSARICALHGQARNGPQAALLQGPEFRCVQVAKSSHEAADLEKRLKEESDKASFAA